MAAVLNSDSAYEVNNENLYLARCSAVDFRRLQALRIQTLDIHGDRGDLQAPVQRATNKRAGRADILTARLARKAVSQSQHAYVSVTMQKFSRSRSI
jgi:hypothetical protein